MAGFLSTTTRINLWTKWARLQRFNRNRLDKERLKKLNANPVPLGWARRQGDGALCELKAFHGITQFPRDPEWPSKYDPCGSKYYTHTFDVDRNAACYLKENEERQELRRSK